MTKTDKLRKLEAEAPEEIPKFLKAAKLLKEINGLSISGDEQTFEDIKKILSFEPTTKEGKELKTNLLKMAKKKAGEGMFGDGVFLIS